MILNVENLDAAYRSTRLAIDEAIAREKARGEIGYPDLREASFAYLDRGGKRLRPLLVHLAAGAAGGDPSAVGPTALAVEVFHTWTLIHDDLIDHDSLRRGGPTVHAGFRKRSEARVGLSGRQAQSYGDAVAILAGDYLQGVAARLVLDNARERGVSITTAVAAANLMQTDLLRDLVEGEIEDVALTHDRISEVGEPRLIEMYRQKTASLIAYCARAGAMLGLDDADPSAPTTDALAGFAEACGIAFQIRDDVLGIAGDEARLGKPVGSDIREGKRTIILVHAHARADSGDRARLDRVIGDPDADPREVAWVLDALTRLGGLEHARSEAERYLEKARAHLRAIPPSVFRDLLSEWAEGLVKRET